MATIKHQAINTLKKGDYFKMYTHEECIIKISDDKKRVSHKNIPEKISKTVYVYDGYNRFGKRYTYHPFEDVNKDLGTKDKNRLVTTDFEF